LNKGISSRIIGGQTKYEDGKCLMSASSHICFELFATKLDIAKLYLQLMKNLQKLKTDSGTE